MSRPLSLAAYLALRRGSVSAPSEEPPPDRPPGPLVWVHCPDPARHGAVVALARRHAAEHGPATLLLTAAEGPSERGLIRQPPPPDLRPAARAFLDHWRPDCMIWIDALLHPALLAETDSPPLPRVLIGTGDGPPTLSGGAWMPGVQKALLSMFDHVLVNDRAEARQFVQAGLPQDRVEITGPLDDAPPVLPCLERDRADLAETIGPRPVWLAAEVTLPELDAIAEAHRQASRSAHRLLLILVPRDMEVAAVMASEMRDHGFDVSCRADGTEPGEATQVYIAEGGAEMGLWYRLAPLTFLGGTLAGEGGRHPFEPASLGSAVVHGPATSPHASAYLKLARAGACRAVNGGSDLGRMVETLLAPDKAAELARAAWDVTSRGAESGARILSLVREALDRAEG